MTSRERHFRRLLNYCPGYTRRWYPWSLLPLFLSMLSRRMWIEKQPIIQLCDQDACSDVAAGGQQGQQQGQEGYRQQQGQQGQQQQQQQGSSSRGSSRDRRGRGSSRDRRGSSRGSSKSSRQGQAKQQAAARKQQQQQQRQQKQWFALRLWPYWMNGVEWSMRGRVDIASIYNEPAYTQCGNITR